MADAQSTSMYTEALKLYKKAGFKHIDRYNDNAYADVFMEIGYLNNRLKNGFFKRWI